MRPRKKKQKNVDWDRIQRFQRLMQRSVFGHSTVISGKRQEISALGRSDSTRLGLIMLYKPLSARFSLVIILHSYY